MGISLAQGTGARARRCGSSLVIAWSLCAGVGTVCAYAADHAVSPLGADSGGIETSPIETARGSAHETALTVDDAIREALANNRDLRAAYLTIDQARARLVQAGLWPNPSLELSGARDFAFADEGEYNASLAFDQRFPIAGRLARARDVARVDVALALAEVRDVTRRLIGAVQGAFYELLVLEAQVMVRDELIDVDRRLVELSEGRATLAEVSPIDVDAARVEMQRLVFERDVLAAQAQAQAKELARLLGRAPETPTLPVGELAPGPPPASLPDLRSEGLRKRPDLQQALLAADRARGERALAKAERWEDWAIGLGYDRERAVIDGAPAQGADQFLGLRLSLPLPMWNRNQGRIAEASALEAQTERTIAALELTIATEIEVAYRRGEALRGIVERYQASLAPLTAQTVRLSQDAYRQGLVDVTHVVQAQRQQGELRTAYLDALAQYRRAAIELEVATAASPFLRGEEESR